MKRICILTQSHLCRNPRVVKEARSLASAGYEVVILTTFSSDATLQEDKKLLTGEPIEYRPVVDLRTRGYSALRLRLARRVAGELVSRFGFETPGSLGYGPYRFLRAAREVRADLYIAHQELAAWVGVALLDEGNKVAFDLEDWYSEDLLPSARRHRPLKLLRKIEASALTRGTYCVTTSQAMARAMAAEHGCRPPAVIYNSFPLAQRNVSVEDTSGKEKMTMHWFSQTIGPGRGLEKLLKALAYVPQPVSIHLRGEVSDSYRAELYARFPSAGGHELHLHPLVSPPVLVDSIAAFHVGLALEESIPASRNLTVTNKILQYLLAGIPVIASDTEGQKEIAQQAPAAVLLFANDSPAALASRIQELVQAPEKLRAARQAAENAAQAIFCWEKEEKKLLRLVESALHPDGKMHLQALKKYSRLLDKGVL